MSDALPNLLPAQAANGRGTRILSLCFPRLLTDRIIRLRRAGQAQMAWETDGGASPDAKPLAVVAKIKSALRVIATDAAADRRGIRVGQSLADARGAHPDLLVEESDPAADRAVLEGIADWCDRYTPLVSLDPPLGLFLDVSGCSHLFAKQGGDGEVALAADCLRRLAAQGFEARGGIASTAGAAWALAHYGEGGCVLPGDEAAALSPLPVAALRITEDQADLLDRLGLKRIGQLFGKPRAPLAARFGMGLVRRLDQALGSEDEVLSPRRPAPRFSAERRFAEPVSDQDSLLLAVESLARSLAPALERHGLGARHLEAAFFRLDGKVLRATVGTATPVRAAKTVEMLFAERLSSLKDDWDAGFGFDVARLSVVETEALVGAQIDLSGGEAAAPDLSRLVDRLGARLGPQRITRFVPVDTHIPERAAAAQPIILAGAAAPAWPMPEEEAEAPPDRPLRLFARPEPVEVLAEVPEGPPLRFRWRRVVHVVARAEGPERIAAEWWRPEDAGQATRDYYRVEDSGGRRYWLYREGLYGRETGTPSWYVHGLFG